LSPPPQGDTRDDEAEHDRQQAPYHPSPTTRTEFERLWLAHGEKPPEVRGACIVECQLSPTCQPRRRCVKVMRLFVARFSVERTGFVEPSVAVVGATGAVGE